MPATVISPRVRNARDPSEVSRGTFTLVVGDPRVPTRVTQGILVSGAGQVIGPAAVIAGGYFAGNADMLGVHVDCVLGSATSALLLMEGAEFDMDDPPTHVDHPAGAWARSAGSALDTTNDALALAVKSIRITTATFKRWVNIPLEGEGLFRWRLITIGSNGGDTAIAVGMVTKRIRA